MASAAWQTDRIKSLSTSSATQSQCWNYSYQTLFFCHVGRWVGLDINPHWIKTTQIKLLYHFDAMSEMSRRIYLTDWLQGETIKLFWKDILTAPLAWQWHFCHYHGSLQCVHFCHGQLVPHFSFLYSPFSQVRDSNVVTSSNTVLAMDR